MNQRATFHAETPLQALLQEQALLLAKQLESAAAPDGQVLAVPAAREPARQAVQATRQAQAEAAEKKGRWAAPAGNAFVVARLRGGCHNERVGG
jgi:hypothetical protein